MKFDQQHLPGLKDCVAFAGLGLLGYGLWLVYEPAAFLGVGVILLILAVWQR
mgnify:CR=1 FL=1